MLIKKKKMVRIPKNILIFFPNNCLTLIGGLYSNNNETSLYMYQSSDHNFSYVLIKKFEFFFLVTSIILRKKKKNLFYFPENVSQI